MRVFVAPLIVVFGLSGPALAEEGSLSVLDGAKHSVKKQVEKLHEGKTGAALVTANILACAGPQVGSKAAYGFYGKLRQTTAAMQGLCRKQQPEAAKAMLLSAIEAHQHDAATRAVVGCYQAQDAGAVVKAVGPTLAARANSYARWSQNPDLAKREITDRDVCGG